MEIHYGDNKLEKLCTDEREMRRKRSYIAGKLRLRIKALEAAPSVGDLQSYDPLGRWHPHTADLDGLWAGKLSANHRLVIRPHNLDDPLPSVIVTVIKIDDYH